MAAVVPFIPYIVAAAGTFMQMQGQQAAGRAEAARGRRLKQLGEFEAAQLEVNAGQELASSQRTAMEEERQARFAESRALAVAAASGGGASDPTVQKIISDISGMGAYRKSVALYEGEERARQMRLGAATRRMEGEAGLQAGAAAQRAYNIGAAGSLLSGAGRIGTAIYERSLLQKYGGGGPNATTRTNQDSYGGYNQDAGIPGLGDYA
jgi:hypothetical protein